METKIEKIITKEPSAYILDDSDIVDITIESTKSFISIIKAYNCPNCDTSIITNNERLLKLITNTVHGTFITCNSCKTDYFIHLIVSDETTKFKDTNMFDF